jgi:hypothetical protein
VNGTSQDSASRSGRVEHTASSDARRCDVGLDQVGPAPQHASPFARRAARPVAALVRRVGIAHGRIDGRSVGQRQRRMRPAIGRSMHREACCASTTRPPMKWPQGIMERSGSK